MTERTTASKMGKGCWNLEAFTYSSSESLKKLQGKRNIFYARIYERGENDVKNWTVHLFYNVKIAKEINIYVAEYCEAVAAGQVFNTTGLYRLGNVRDV